MKKFTKLLGIVLIIALVMSMGIMAWAEDGTTAATTGTITITPPTGLQDTDTNVYKIYKVFDAAGDGTNISYKLVSGKTTAPDGFSVDSAGNVTYAGTEGATELTAADIAAIAAYVTEDDLVATVNATGSTAVTAANLPNGYYYITTSTGSVVTIDSTNPNAEVNDKNTVPSLTKEITGASSYDEDGKKALAQIGTDVEYTATITVGKGMVGYEFHDTMSSGLTLKPDTISVTYSAKPDGYGKETVKTGTDAGSETIVIEFPDGLAEGTTITITYSATINEEALTQDPENNTAYVKYGDENSNNKTPEQTTQTWNAQISVLKKDGNNTEASGDDTPLPGAGFVLKNSAGKYYHLNTTNADAPVVEWVDNYDKNSDVHTSAADGTVPAFTGLADGTYTLEEVVVPAGYNKAADKTVTIEAHDYTAANLEQEVLVLNNKGSVLPSTGGIGTTIFYVVGSIMVVAAGVLLITKKRMSREG